MIKHHNTNMSHTPDDELLAEFDQREVAAAHASLAREAALNRIGLLPFMVEQGDRLLPRNGILLDLEPKGGAVPVAIAEERPDARIVLVQPNPYLCSAAARLCQESGISCAVYDTVGYEMQTQRGRLIRRVFSCRPECQGLVARQADARVHIVQDDIRRRDAIAHLLDGMNSDVVMYPYPAAGIDEIVEMPYEFPPLGEELRIPEVRSRGAGTLERKFEGALHVAARQLHRGGSLIYSVTMPRSGVGGPLKVNTRDQSGNWRQLKDMDVHLPPAQPPTVPASVTFYLERK
jgi:hypothetical protein